MSVAEDFTDFEDPADNQVLNDSMGTDDFDSMGIDDLGGLAVPPMEKHNDLLKNLTNFNRFLKDMINGWIGLVWNEEEGKYAQDKSVEPVMNIKGARWCVDFLKVYTRDNNIITNISQKDYVNIMCDVIDNVWLNIGTRYEEFNIKSNGDILTVCNQMEHSIGLVLMGAGDGKYNDLLSTVTTRNESINNSQQQNPMMNGMMQAPMMMGGFQGMNGQMPSKGLFGNIKNRLLGR